MDPNLVSKAQERCQVSCLYSFQCLVLTPRGYRIDKIIYIKNLSVNLVVLSPVFFHLPASSLDGPVNVKRNWMVYAQLTV